MTLTTLSHSLQQKWYWQTRFIFIISYHKPRDCYTPDRTLGGRTILVPFSPIINVTVFSVVYVTHDGGIRAATVNDLCPHTVFPRDDDHRQCQSRRGAVGGCYVFLFNLRTGSRATERGNGSRARGNSHADLPTIAYRRPESTRYTLSEPYISYERSVHLRDRRTDKSRAWTGTRDGMLLPMMIFEKMPTAAKVMLLAMFHSRDGFRSFGMIHLMSYTIAPAATTVPDDWGKRTTARRFSEWSGNGFPAIDRPGFRNTRQPSSSASPRAMFRDAGHVAARARPSGAGRGRAAPALPLTPDRPRNQTWLPLRAATLTRGKFRI